MSGPTSLIANVIAAPAAAGAALVRYVVVGILHLVMAGLVTGWIGSSSTRKRGKFAGQGAARQELSKKDVVV